jgi:hypothetical protein
MYPDITTINATAGVHTVLLYIDQPAILNGMFMWLLFVSLLLITTLGTFMFQVRRLGQGDFPVCFMAGSFVTFGAVIIMAAIPGLVSFTMFGVFLAITIVAFILLMGTKTQY